MRFVTWEKSALRFYSVLLLSLFLVIQSITFAERLPIKTYTTEEGLIRNLIRQILQDSNGYLWLVTPSGLSRFDGYEFKNYGEGQTALLSLFWRMIEDRNGGYWLATAGAGLFRFRPQAIARDSASQFESYSLGTNPQADFVYALCQDHAGKIWCGGRGGLYCLDQAKGENTFREVELGLSPEEKNSAVISNVLEDPEDNLWIGSSIGLFRRLPDGRIVRYRLAPSSKEDVGAIFCDRNGRMWIEHNNGLIVLVPEAAAGITGDITPHFLSATNSVKPGGDILIRLPSLPGEARRFTESDGFLGKDISDMCQSFDGKVWLGMYDKGLLCFDGTHFRLYAKEEGLSHYKVRSLAEDRQGNLWIGTDGAGLMKKVRGGFTSFSAADGIDETLIAFMVGDMEGGIAVATDLRRASRFDGKGFHVLRGTALDKLMKDLTGDLTHIYYASPTLEDHTGKLWFSTNNGLYRFPPLQRVEQLAASLPEAIYTTKDGLPSNKIFRLFEDSHGDIWISFLDLSAGLLCRWERATNTFHKFGTDDGLVATDNIASIGEDRGGNIWLGFGTRTGKGGQMARFDGKRFQMFATNDGVPEGSIRDLHTDSQGRLWIASSRGGLGRIDNPAAEQPAILKYTIAGGLADDEINCVAEDRWGKIYAGMGRGLDRIDPETERIRHFSVADGLSTDDVRKIFRDAQMNFWIGTTKGLFRFTPEMETPRSAPPIFITRLVIAGQDQPISEAGEKQIANLELETNRNNLQIDFVSPDLTFATTIKYEYKLEGTNQDWSPLTNLRAVNYANLAPGRYRFLVRAVGSDGTASSEPAVVTFRILANVWRRWWFLTLSGLLILALAAVVARLRHARQRERRAAEAALRQAREERLRELEQVRRRIAIDLHDDVGSSLTQISLLSEVVRQSVDGNGKAVSQPLTLIAQISRELVDSMSDIVWAINPNKDTLNDLSRRMRHFASDVLTARQIDFHFRTPGEEQDIKVGSNVRREVFLMFKEGINNLVRHSRCKKADIEFRVDTDNLILRISDDGQGFDTAQSGSGHGLMSMVERSESLGGKLEMSSAPGKGTVLTFRIPLHQPEKAMGQAPPANPSKKKFS